MSVVVLGPNKPFWGARVVQIPFFRTLRDHYPDRRVILFTPADGAEELAEWGLVDEVRRYRRGRGPLAWTTLWAAIRRVRPERLFNLRRRSIACGLLAVGAPGRRTGHRHGPIARLLDERFPYDSRIYMSSRYLSLLTEEARGARDSRSIPSFRAWMESRRLDRPHGTPRVLLFPGAGHGAKKWPLERFLAAAGPLGEVMGCAVTIVLGPGEEEERERLSGSLSGGDHGPTLPRGALGNRIAIEVRDRPTLAELLALVDAATLSVANDCGPSHLAQLSGRRFLGLYREGWSTLEDWFLDKENSELLVAPEDGGLAEIGIDAVVEAATRLSHRDDYAGSFVRFSRSGLSIPRAHRS